MQHIKLTAGMYGFFAGLAQAAKQQPEHALCWWETGATCERRYRVGEQWYNLRPDALAEYRMRSQQMHFWLEWDCGTMNVRDLAIKFTSYAHYIASPDIAQERRVQRVAQARLAHTHGLVLWTTTEVLFHEQGPLAPIWLQGNSQPSRTSQPGGSHRQCLFDAMLGKNCT